MENEAYAVGRAFVEAFARADRAAIADCLAEDLLAGVTQADGSTAELVGRDAYLAAVDALDLAAVKPEITVPQMVAVGGDAVLMMVEIRADRPGRTLHNFAAFLLSVAAGRIRRIVMVDARPAESDAFWKG